MARRIYFDNAAGTPVDPRVLSYIQKVTKNSWGNPSSIHQDGVAARAIVEGARREIAAVLHAHADEIIFTSGGTEANNLAILGVARHAKAAGLGNHIIVSEFEHHSVKAPVALLEQEGFDITYIKPTSNGLIDPLVVGEALTEKTVLISIMYANNEIGTVQPIAEIARTVRHFRRKNKSALYPLVHTDACQATGNLALSVIELGIDLMTINAHKAHGPAGAGVLYVKRGVPLEAITHGGGQERQLRSGTENVAAIAGAARAISLAEQMREEESIRLCSLRDYCLNRIREEISHVELNGDASFRLPGNLNISFAGCESEQLVIELDAKGFSVSSGSACTTSDLESSYVILSLGKGEEAANSAVRFSFGRYTTKKDIDELLRFLPDIITKLRRYTRFA